MIWNIMIWPEIIWLVNFPLYDLYALHFTHDETIVVYLIADAISIHAAWTAMLVHVPPRFVPVAPDVYRPNLVVETPVLAVDFIICKI